MITRPLFRRCLATLTIIALFGIADTSVAVEQAAYSVESADPPCEVRAYAASVVAMVHVDGERSAAVNAGFRILANYIFGGNRLKTKVAMTAPVTQRPAVQGQQDGAAGWDVRFTMPAAYTMDRLPAPQDGRVRLLQVPAHRVAAIQFSGLWSDANLNSHKDQLRRWMSAKKLATQGAPAYAFYDPPWTPWFLRTIEVLIDIAPITG